MEASSPSKEEEEKPANGNPLDLVDIEVWGDLEISPNFPRNAVESSSIGNFGTGGCSEGGAEGAGPEAAGPEGEGPEGAGTEGGTQGAGMDMAGLNGKANGNGKLQDEVDGSTHCSRTGAVPLFDYTSAFTTTSVFRTEEEMRQWITSTGKLHGFVIVVMASEKAPKNRRPRMRFSCERSGKYRPYVSKAKGKGGKVNEVTDNVQVEVVKGGQKKLRITGSKKCECPFELRCVKGFEGWTVTVVNGTHNHDPAKQLEGHAYVGRLSLEERELLVDMSASSLSRPREILSLMKAKDPSNVTTIKSVYNARYKHRFMERAGRTQMQFLFSKLQENEYIYFHKKDDEGCVTHLFWSHPTSVELMHAFPTVLLMDCTYKTNRYRFPFFQMVGVTSTDKTFSVAQAFMHGEKEENYVWVLENLKDVMDPGKLPSVIVTDRDLGLMNAIEKVFPTAKHLLCRWHIDKNVTANCRKFFDDRAWLLFTNSWTNLMFSYDIPTYERVLAAMKRDFSFLYPKAIEYIERTWLGPYKERFVSAWTDNVMHFGNQTSNRAEAEHSKLKAHMRNSQADFESAWSHCHDLVKLQIVEVKATFERSLTCIQHEFNIPLFAKCRGAISQAAMVLMMPEIKKVEDKYVIPNGDCVCPIRRTHGLPCAHMIIPFKEQKLPIPLELIHEHWKTLSLERKQDDSILGLIRADFELFFTKLSDLNSHTQDHWRKKLKSMYFPSSSSLKAPKILATVRGRPKGSLNKSMRRDPSFFEHVEASMETAKLAKEKTRKAKAPSKTKSLISKEKKGQKKTPKAKAPSESKSLTSKATTKSTQRSSGRGKRERTATAVKQTPRKKRKLVKKLFESIPYVDQFPERIRDFMHCTDVLRDGNCGFRVVSMFWHQSEHQWQDCRGQMLKEVQDNYDLYEKVTGLKGGAKLLCERLAWFHIHLAAPMERWMTFPNMGHVIASTYNVVVVFLSRRQCLTFLPLRSCPPLLKDINVMAIGLVNDNHFVKVHLDPNCPIPPIANNWFKFRYDEAKGWESPFLARVEEFKALVGDDVATKESFN